ncbi:MAG: VWA domain-containing protein [Bryobacteraceae bacterium]|jgi:VWFA-related protein
MRSYALVPALLICELAFCQAPEAVIRSSVREVLLDVVVRDAHGRLINDLKPGEIAVYEDGVRQDVRSFRLVAGSEVRVEDEKQAAEAQAAGSQAVAPDTAHPPVNPLRTVNVVCLILNDLNPETRGFAFESARKFVIHELRPNTFIGVFSLDAGGLRPVFPFSNNREHLLKAVELAAVNQLPAVNVGSAAVLSGLSMQVTGAIAPPGSGTQNADGSSPVDPLGTRGDMGFAVNAGLREIDALIGLVQQLSPLPFQKTVLLMGTGLTRPPDQLEYWDSLIHQATKGGVTFYALDVWGLGICQDAPSGSCLAAQSASAPSVAMMNYVSALSQQQGPASIGQSGSAGSSSPNAAHGPPAVSPAAVMMELAHEDDYVKFTVSSANRQEAIRELAERTGGFLIANTNNTDKLLAHVMEEVDTHYEIAYPPKSESEDGHFRKVEVKLARTGLRVETRSGYFAVPDTGERPVTPEEMAGLRALDTQPRPHAFDFLSRAYRFREAGGTAQYAIAFEMPISNLTAAPGPLAKTHALHASLLAVVKDAQGQIVDRVSKDVPSVVSDDRLGAIQVELMTYEHAVSLAPGQYTVETAVVDHEGNRASTGILHIDNRERRGVGLSDLTLVRRLERLGPPPDPADPFEYTGKRVLPFVATHLFSGAIPFVYMVIYPEPGNAVAPDLSVRLLKNGRLLTTIHPALPPAEDSGAIPMVIEPTSKPGNYEVRATVAQGGSSIERSLSYTVSYTVAAK